MPEADTLSPPPQFPGEMPPRPSAWPNVIGVLAIIYAIVNLLGNGCGAALPLWWPAFMRMAEEDMTAEEVQDAQYISDYIGWIAIACVLGITLSVTLLIGAIGLLRRRRATVGLLQFWSWAHIFWAFAGAVFGLLVGPRTGGDILVNACGAAFGLVLPILLLIWFSRPQIKAEVAAWN